MLRILQIIDSLSSGGAEMMCVRIANEVARHSGSSHIVATRSLGDLQQQLDPRVVVYCLNKRSSCDLVAFSKLLWFVTSRRINIIHAHSSSIFFGAGIKLILYRVLLVWHDHYGDSENLRSRPVKLLKCISKIIDGVIAVNKNLVDWSERNIKIKNVVLINNIVDLGQYRFQPRFDFDGNIKILLVANFRPQKNHELAIEVIKQLQSIYPYKFSLCFVGKVVDQKCFERISTKICLEQLKVEIDVHQSDSSESIGNSHVCLLTSYSEGMPLALLEYGAVGRPIVTTGVGQIPDLFNDRESCMICRLDDPDEFVRAIIEIVNDRKLREEMVERCRKVIEDNFSGASFMLKYIELINKLKKVENFENAS
jgi:glycosyltransferase involved in cell wall biosynthesis